MNPTELEIGGVYFILSFHDGELLIPDISTRIYLGRNLVAGLPGATFFFQDAERHQALGAWKEGLDATEYGLVTCDEAFLECVFDYAGLQRQLEYMKRGGAKSIRSAADA